MTSKKKSGAEPSSEVSEPKLEEYWDDLKEGLKIPKLTDDQLRRFVDDFLSGRLFSLHHIRESQRPQMVGMVFLPVAMGAFSAYNPESLKVVGTVYEYTSKALPRSINGYPIFTSMHILHAKDWQRAVKAIQAEEKRRESIELPPAEDEG